MRYFRMFLIYFQDILDERLRAFVWFINPLVNGGFFMLFWLGTFHGNRKMIAGWDIQSILIYYLLVLIASSMLMSHYEEVIEVDIRNSNIIRYLLKPFPYYAFTFFEEFPSRLLQGSYAICTYLIIAWLYPPVRLPLQDILTTGIVILSFVGTFFLSHTYKLILGMLAFWTNDIRVFTETSEVIMLFLGGFMVPLSMLPHPWIDIVNYFPFAYFVYYPVLGLEGKLSFMQTLQTSFLQFCWLLVFVIGYKIMLKQGLRKFTAAGQ